MFSIDSLTQRLGKVSHFKDLPPNAILQIVKSGKVEFYSKDKKIFFESDPCAGLFVLFRGRVNLCKISLQGQESIITVINPVIMFNEVSVLDGGPNPLTAIADLDSVVWRVDCKSFQQLTKHYPIMALSLLPVLAARNRLMLSYCEDVSFLSVKGRTAKTLLDLSRNGQIEIDRQVYNNQILSAMVTTVPEPLCRALRDLRHINAIKCTRSFISVLDLSKLAQIAEVVSDCCDGS